MRHVMWPIKRQHVANAIQKMVKTFEKGDSGILLMAESPS